MSAQERIIIAGLRPTKARLAVLNTIADADSALSHPEILERLSTQKEFDRVTIYRVLDWLTEHDLVHKISGENRAWKFQLSQQKFTSATAPKATSAVLSNNHHHAHLHCKVCGKVTCVHELEPHFPAPLLAQYQVTSIDINIKGVCADCASLK
ncbi:Fe2+/Zn2+ uptake regulation protein [Methylophilaceae bacterium 11]|jgi:Fur family ferric uptake transcriptional regulator|uniref:Fur family transcriptional regulator n=1 Tax=unclassified Methylotenera TaxID=2643294 RepID=UPI00037B148D|nr:MULTISPECIES: transcriptional repressor [unclassified Methylotenera]EUJ10068.1 Fe2+/Zn2+ uptake regulation protein [Methylophilaceae bacterium 11]